MNQRRVRSVVGESTMVLLGLVFIYPLVLVVLNSFKSYGEIYNSPLSFPTTLRFENYVFVWNDMKYLSKIINSIVVTVSPIPFILFFGALAAYKLVRTKTVLSRILFYFFTSTMLIPLNVIMVPLLIMARQARMLDRLMSLILIYVALSTPFAIFLYHGFIKNIKMDIEEAARIDGCGSFKMFLNIVFPMLKPITTTILILLVLAFWNDFFLPLLFISKDAIKTLPLVAYKYHGQFMKEWSKILPAVVLLSVPIFIFFFFFQRYILEGIAQGAVKG